MNRIAVLRGDGIGPEVINAALSLVPGLGDRIEIRFVEQIGIDYFHATGKILSEDSAALIRASKFILLGAFTTPTPRPPGYQSIIGYLRTTLDLAANIRPFRSIPRFSLRPFDVTLFRENTEDLYFQKQIMRSVDVAVGEKVISRTATDRIARHAFDFAVANNKRNITIITKANVLDVVDGFFWNVAAETLHRCSAEQGYEVNIEHLLVDTAAYWLVKTPSRFEVIVTTNLYGDILSDLIAGMSGSLGLCPSVNQGARHAMFEPIHGSAPDIAGKGIANPTGAILAMTCMLRQAGFARTAIRIEAATLRVLEEGCVTPDLGGTATTSDLIEQIADATGQDIW